MTPPKRIRAPKPVPGGESWPVCKLPDSEATLLQQPSIERAHCHLIQFEHPGRPSRAKSEEEEGEEEEGRQWARWAKWSGAQSAPTGWLAAPRQPELSVEPKGVPATSKSTAAAPIINQADFVSFRCRREPS